MKLFVKGQVVFDSKLFSGKVVPSESYCTISDGEVDVFLCKSHKTTNKAEWWPSLFQGDPLMPRLPAMAQSPDLKPPSSFPARRGPSRCGKLCLGVLGLLLALILLLTVTGFALSQSRDLRHQTFAFVWEHMAPLVHANLRPQKEALFSEYRHKLRGRVLELGPGFGANFQHFPKDGSMTWVGIEPTTFMLDGLREAVELSGFPADHAEVVGASAEDFFASVPDNSIDTVVATLVLCSVHDQGRVVAEIARVLKPGGSFLLLEHMAADPSTLDRQLQDWLTPLWALFGDNCHLNRPTNELFDNGFPDPWIDIELKRFDFILKLKLKLKLVH